MAAMSSRKKRHLIQDFEARSVALVGACLLVPLAAAAHGLQNHSSAQGAQARAGDRRALVAYIGPADMPRSASMPPDPCGA